jgi:predicted DNA-binding antitoxin AbrB/MazE fold protein
MLVVEGFLENGVFIPNKPLVALEGRQYATLTITENEEKERQERITAWRQFGEAIINSDEELEGEPERLRFRSVEEII